MVLDIKIIVCGVSEGMKRFTVLEAKKQVESIEEMRKAAETLAW